MAPSVSELLKKQQEQINDLKKKYLSLETKINKIGDFGQDKETKEQAEETSAEKVIESPEQKTVRHEQNNKNLFRVFGSIGVFMIILGLVFFYKDTTTTALGGIMGRIVLGIVVSIILLGIAIAFYKNNYVPFSQILMIGSLGAMYFTIFATYHFTIFRTTLGMSLIGNTILLLAVMLAGLFLGMKMNLRFVVYGSLLLGYVAAFLSGIDGNTLHILIYILIINIVVYIMSIKKEWFLGIPAQVLTYIAFSIWFGQGLISPQSLLSQTSQPVLITFFFLVAYYAIFTAISFKQASTVKEGEGIGLFIINTVSLLGFGLALINHYFSELNGLYIILVAALTLFVGFKARNKDYKKLFDIAYLLTLVQVGIAIPVQFDQSVVTILWVMVALGLTYAGKKSDYKLMLYTGYYGFIITLGRVLFYDFWFLQSLIERVLAIGSVLVGIYLINKLVRSIEQNFQTGIYSVVGITYAVIWIARELYGAQIATQTAHILVSLLWAAFAVILIFVGVSQRKKLYNWTGIILFGVSIAKVLIVDLMSMQSIYKVVALIIVGLLALVGAFLYAKNKDKMKEIL